MSLFLFVSEGHPEQAHKAVTATVPDISAEHGPADGFDGQDAVVATSRPRRDKEVPQGVWDGAPGAVVHAMQVEEGLQSFR